MTNFSIFLKSFLFTSLLVLIFNHQAFAAKKQRNWRIGLGRMINTVYYGYETKNKDSSYAKIEQNSTGQVYNTVLVMEYLFGGRKSPALSNLKRRKKNRKSHRHGMSKPLKQLLSSGHQNDIIRRNLAAGRSGAQIVKSWARDEARFREQRAKYLLYN